MASSVFITGATGVVGSHLLKMLLADNNEVTALVRGEASSRAMRDAGVRPVFGDIRDSDGWSGTMRGVDVVFHVAGVNEVCPKDPDLMRSVNVDGAVAVVKASAEAGVTRVVLTSSVAAIGEAEGMIGTETTRHSGTYLSAYARTKHEGELAAMSAATDRGIEMVVVNPASVQGPGRSTGSTEMLLRILRSKRPLLYDAVISVVDIEDCSHGHLLAAEFGLPGERYILSGATMSVSELVETVNAIVDTPVTPRWLSRRTVATLGIPLTAIVSVFRPDSVVCPDLVRTILHSHRFSNTRSREELGLVYASVESTIARTLSWFQEEGLTGVR